MHYYAYIEDLKGDRYPVRQDGGIVTSRKVNGTDMGSYETAWNACFGFRVKTNKAWDCVAIGGCELSANDYIRKFGSLDAPYDWTKDWLGLTWV